MTHFQRGMCVSVPIHAFKKKIIFSMVWEDLEKALLRGVLII